MGNLRKCKRTSVLTEKCGVPADIFKLFYQRVTIEYIQNEVQTSNEKLNQKQHISCSAEIEPEMVKSNP